MGNRPIDVAQSSGTSSPSHEELLTPEELATKLKIPKSTVFELTRKRTAGSRSPMPKLKVGKFVRFRYSEVISWMEKNGQARSAFETGRAPGAA